jgi:hypothetical protein
MTARNPNRNSPLPALILTGSAILRDMIAGAESTPQPVAKPVPVLKQSAAVPSVSAILNMVSSTPKVASPVPAPAPKPVAPPAPVSPVAVSTPRNAPAPAPKPAAVASWARLPGGEWGIRAGVDALPGEWVTVKKKNGGTSRVKLGEKSNRVGVFYKAGRAPKRKPRRQCPGNGLCRSRGYRKGPRCNPRY